MSEKKAEPTSKLLELRRILRSQDWSDDGTFFIPSRPNGGYTYVSAEKAKRQFNEALEQAGVNMQVVFSDLQKHDSIGNMSQHWTVKCTMKIFADGEFLEFIAFGEAGDSGDKGVNKAQTDAIKQIIFNEFLVADSSDPEGNVSDIEAPPAGRRIPVPPQRLAEIKEKLATSQVKPAEPSEPAPAKAPEPVQEPPKEEAVPAPVQTGEAPANAIQTKAIERIIMEQGNAKNDGLITDLEYQEVCKQAHEALASSKLASQFILAHKRKQGGA